MFENFIHQRNFATAPEMLWSQIPEVLAETSTTKIVSSIKSKTVRGGIPETLPFI